MKNVLRYKGYLGTVEYSDADAVLFGQLVGIRHIVSYEGDSVLKLQAAFEEAVDDYLEGCEEDGEQPQRPLSGKFSLRLGPDLHRQLTDRATASGKSLNEVAVEAIKAHLQHQ
ncbi:MAG: type II toxin-antitoxin system HicB family antitoxin [Bacteroidota bacterium]